MPDKKILEQIIADPASTAKEQAKAREQIAALGVTDEVEELLRYAGKASLEQVEDLQVFRYCNERRSREGRWPHALYDKWLAAYFTTAEGSEQLAEIASRIRACDFEQWKNAADEWRDSGWKDTRRLIEVLDRIVADPVGVHGAETRAGAGRCVEFLKRS